MSVTSDDIDRLLASSPHPVQTTIAVSIIKNPIVQAYINKAIDDSGGGGGGGTTPGTYIFVAPTAGSKNNYDPSGGSGFPVGYDRVDIDTSAGDVTVTGFLSTGVVDGQEVLVANIGANILKLTDQDAGSTAANRFRGAGGDTAIDGPGIIRLKYYKQGVNRWVVVP